MTQKNSNMSKAEKALLKTLVEVKGRNGDIRGAERLMKEYNIPRGLNVT